MKHLQLLTYSFSALFILALASCGDEESLDEDIYLNYQTITDLELPFEEEWYTATGGRTYLDGRHHFGARGERYAYDFLIEIDGRIRTGDGSKNEDYYCFGKRLNAPGAGTIIDVVNNIADNQPRNANRDNAGNYIIIDHLNGESSVMAHLKKGSVIVSVGDTVIKGQEVGKTGNSGASDIPHLHYHIQGTSGNLNGVGLPAQFLNYYEDNVLVERGEPVATQSIRKN